MKFTDAIDLILNSDPRVDWLQVPTPAAVDPVGTFTYILLNDINLRIELGPEKIDPHSGEVLASSADVSGGKWRQVCQVAYGPARLGYVSLDAISQRAADGGTFVSGPITFVPVPRCGPDSCALVSRFDYQIARVLDLFDAVDSVLEREGYGVEAALTGKQYLERVKEKQGATITQVRSLLAQRQRTEQAAEMRAPRPLHRIANGFRKK